MFSASRIIKGALAALAVTMIPLGIAQPAHAQSELCFNQTNQCVSGRFRTYWEQNGGLAIFGYPITPARQEINADTGQSYLTQSFERNRFELHPENAAPYDVLLGRLGDARLGQLGRNWRNEDRASGPKDGCLFFPQTGHNVCDQAPGTGGAQAGFMSYWRTEGLSDSKLDAYGQSLALHGLPLTEARQETNANGDTVLTQWFERGRFEWHPNNPSNFRVLLGLLGNETRGTTPTPPPATRSLHYFWPKRIPQGMRIERAISFADDVRFELHMSQPNGGQFSAVLRGGYGSENPPRSTNPRNVTVRGQKGVAITTGAGYAVYWTEDDKPYAITGNLGLDDALALAEQAETLNLSAWNQRLSDTPNDTNTLKTYTHPDGLWSIQYPSDLLKPENYGDGVIAFVSSDRSTIAAVESYHADDDEFGSGGSLLRAHARATLARLYDREVDQTEVLDATGRWETGIGFETDRAKGEAYYEQRNRSKGDYRVNGFLFGVKHNTDGRTRTAMIAMRDSLQIKAPTASNEDQDKARDVLKKYFQRLSEDRYGEAAALYGGSYKNLQKLNPNIDADDHDALFEAACTDNGYACLRVAQVTRSDTVNASKFQFDVEFRDYDGDIFAANGQTRFTYTVTRSNGGFQVQELPVLPR